ncbi:MAG: hypothetical protein KZQ83_14965 [gamma proteobacterium symbiont of Taylorina sp.]|nr:hypothetical protein [gamma proteobacterium symbiont of Taylorina sp.]
MGFNINARLSGGSSNSDPNLSLGGVISSEKINHQSIDYGGSGIAGVTINSAWGFNESITYDLVASVSIIYLINGLDNSFVDTGNVTGEYTLNLSNSNSGIQFSFDSATHSAGSDTLTATNPLTNLFSDTTAQESTSGYTDHRCIYLPNDGDVTSILDISLPVSDTLESFKIGFDGGGVDATAVTIADEFTPPAGVTFTAPSASVPLNVTLTAGQKIAVWIERTLLPNNLYTKEPSKFQILVNMSS